ncbi:MAG: hypothetical protein IPI67_32180 [Myxococcales bacterium]|nr:hypothetical protein [Myxococcales bacterium]
MEPAPASDADPAPGPAEGSGQERPRSTGFATARERVRARLAPWAESLSRADSPASRVLRVVVWTVCLALTARLFWVLDQMAVHSIIGYDEQYFLWSGWSVTKGLAPYSEAFEYKPPLLFYTQALALKLLGFEHMRYRWFYLFFPLGSVLAVQLSLMRRGANVLATLGFALLASWYFTDPRFHDNHLGDAESIALAYYFLGFACLLAPLRNRRVSDVIGGALMACAVLSKEPVAFTVIGTWAACFFMSEEPGRFSVRAKRYVALTGLGVLSVVVVLLILMLPRGALSGYIALVKSYSTYSDPTKSVCTVLGRFQPTTFWADLPRHWDKLRVDFLNLEKMGPVVPYLAAAAVALVRRSLVVSALSFFVFAAGFYSVTATGCYWSHYYVMTLAGIFCVAGLGLVAMPSAAMPRAVGLWSGVILLALSAAAVYPRYEVEAPKQYPYQPLNVEPRVLQFVLAHSAPGDRIWTTGAPGLYVFADRVSATRQSAILDDYLVQYPGDTDEEKLRPLREQLDRHRPKVVVVDRAYQERKRRTFSVLVFPFLKAQGYQELEKDLWVRP